MVHFQRHLALVTIAALVLLAPCYSDEKPSPTRAQSDAARFIDSKRNELIAINQDIWNYAELGLQEFRSSRRLIDAAKSAGLRVQEGVSGMPTAFVAEFGSGRPIIGILAEYDALPDLSQEAAPTRQPAANRISGHGCGHSALGTAALGAALAVKHACELHDIGGTVRLYGTPAEETLIGKVYMALDGQFKDLDVCLHWHPSSKNRTSFYSTKALISAKFNYSGVAAHASGSPSKGRSALDGVELMNVGVNYMREHLPETSRVHYVITSGGGQPNVVPASAQVWYFVRANSHEEVEKHFDWIVEIAEAAAKMSRTRLAMSIDTDCHEVIPNLPLSKIIAKNFEVVGPPIFDAADMAFAKQLQEPLRADFGLTTNEPLVEKVEPLPEKPYDPESGSTDVGDVSWHIPTSGFSTACFPAESPGHSWQNVASIGSPIGHKGMIVAAKVFAFTALDLLTDPKAIADAKRDHADRLKARPYTTRIPAGQKAPKTIR